MVFSNSTWVCDHAKLDIMLINKYGMKARPLLTLIIDSYSRCIMGLHIGYDDAPSHEVNVLALRHAVLPKNYKLQFKLHSDWNTYGTPKNLLMDRGFVSSKQLKNICNCLGITLNWHNFPCEGSSIERAFRIIDRDFLAHRIGYLDSNIQQLFESAKKEPCWTTEEFHRLLVSYIADDYNQTIDVPSGNQTRFQRWQADLRHPPTLVSEREFDAYL
ncbi:hypothetical protein NIES2101_09445 [Calothrix sp. HK-06]|nr:hypothetical protein NIES2101_09445 [Calothrix sp. HK-06]